MNNEGPSDQCREAHNIASVQPRDNITCINARQATLTLWLTQSTLGCSALVDKLQSSMSCMKLILLYVM